MNKILIRNGLSESVLRWLQRMILQSRSRTCRWLGRSRPLRRTVRDRPQDAAATHRQLRSRVSRFGYLHPAGGRWSRYVGRRWSGSDRRNRSRPCQQCSLAYRIAEQGLIRDPFY